MKNIDDEIATLMQRIKNTDNKIEIHMYWHNAKSELKEYSGTDRILYKILLDHVLRAHPDVWERIYGWNGVDVENTPIRKYILSKEKTEKEFDKKCEEIANGKLYRQEKKLFTFIKTLI